MRLSILFSSGAHDRPGAPGAARNRRRAQGQRGCRRAASDERRGGLVMQPVLTDSQVAMVLAAAQRDMCLGRWEAATVKLEWLVRANAGVPSASPAVVSTALIPWI